MNRYRKTICAVLLLTAFCAGGIHAKTYTKSACAPVPSDKSQDAVRDSLILQLKRELSNETGSLIYSNLGIEDSQITQDDVASISLATIREVGKPSVKPENCNGQPGIRVKVKLEVVEKDTKAISKELMKPENLGMLNRLRQNTKDDLRLENRLKNATPEQYTNELAQANELQRKRQEAVALKYQQLVAEANDEYARTNRQLAENNLRDQQQLREQQHRLAQDDAERMRRAKLREIDQQRWLAENAAEVRRLEEQATTQMVVPLMATTQMSVRQAVYEAKRIRQHIANTVARYEGSLQKNNENIVKRYAAQRQTIESKLVYPEPAPVKGEWEYTNEFEDRQRQYWDRKNAYEQKMRTELATLNHNEKAALDKNTTDSNQSLQRVVSAQAEQLRNLQMAYFPEATRPQATLLSIDNLNADEQYFQMHIKYYDATYTVVFYFNDIGRDQARLLAQTQKQFIIEPLFSLEDDHGDVQAVLSAFHITHLGSKIQRTIYLNIWVEPFPEIKRFWHDPKPTAKPFRLQHPSNAADKGNLISPARLWGYED